ncbi:MAG: hypothetical protein GY786_24105 [Proteobacteria bacterium]|nr:hypothetical protein [Pseudomonadota bacterium]
MEKFTIELVTGKVHSTDQYSIEYIQRGGDVKVKVLILDKDNRRLFVNWDHVVSIKENSVRLSEL